MGEYIARPRIRPDFATEQKLYHLYTDSGDSVCDTTDFFEQTESYTVYTIEFVNWDYIIRHGEVVGRVCRHCRATVVGELLQ